MVKRGFQRGIMQEGFCKRGSARVNLKRVHELLTVSAETQHHGVLAADLIA